MYSRDGFSQKPRNRIPNLLAQFLLRKKKGRGRDKEAPTHNHVMWICKEQDRNVISLVLEL